MDGASEQAFSGSRLALEKDVFIAARTRIKPDPALKLDNTWLSFAKMRVGSAHRPTQDLYQLFRYDGLRDAIARSGPQDVERTRRRSARGDRNNGETAITALEIGDGFANVSRDGVLIQNYR
jgi:hypothetical protein